MTHSEVREATGVHPLSLNNTFYHLPLQVRLLPKHTPTWWTTHWGAYYVWLGLQCEMLPQAFVFVFTISFGRPPPLTNSHRVFMPLFGLFADPTTELILATESTKMDASVGEDLELACPRDIVAGASEKIMRTVESQH